MSVSPGIAEKTKGNEAFQSGDYTQAIVLYGKSAQLLEAEGEGANEDLGKVWANMAECYLRQKEWSAAEDAATKAINADGANVKARYRRAKARFEMKDFAGAVVDAGEVHTQDGIGLLRSARAELAAPDKKKAIFKRIIDSYRMRMEDDYCATGDVHVDSLYSGEEPLPLKHFRGYVRMGAKKKAFPPPFDIETDLEELCTFATEDKFHSIRFCVEADDVRKHYDPLGMPQELNALRRLATQVVGPLASMFGGSDETEGIYDNYSDGPDSFEDNEYWWQEAPFTPNFDIDFEDGEDLLDELCEKLPSFEDRIRDYSWPRWDMSRALQGGWGRPDNLDISELILAERFGKDQNKMSPDRFAQDVLAVTCNQLPFLRVHYSISSDVTQEPLPPTSWLFDHYGVVTALAVAAFRSLPDSDQESADVQQRFVRVLLCGRETPLTLKYLPDEGGKAVPYGEWKGATLEDVIPEGWNQGRGSILMEKAWDIWHSQCHARVCVEAAQAAAESKDHGAVLEHTATGLALPCFHEKALNERGQHGEDRTSWDTARIIPNMYARLVSLRGDAMKATGVSISDVEVHFATALELMPMRGSHCEGFQSRKGIVELTLRHAHILAELERIDEARRCADSAKRTIECHRKWDPEDDMDEELREAVELKQSLAERRGPLPTRTPTVIADEEGWWAFDASDSPAVQDHLLEREGARVGLWAKEVGPRPDIKRLHLHIHDGYVGLSGLSDIFPELEELIVDDSQNCLRVMYNLTALVALAPTLTSLTLDLSGQWMCEGEDALAPIASLTNLRELHITHLRDGVGPFLKNLEKLTNLERLFFDGANEEWGKSPSTLDLSQLVKLKDAVFVECEFCAPDDSVTSTQALILPDAACNVTFRGNLRCNQGHVSETLRNQLEEKKNAVAGFTYGFVFAEENWLDTKDPLTLAVKNLHCQSGLNQYRFWDGYRKIATAEYPADRVFPKRYSYEEEEEQPANQTKSKSNKNKKKKKNKNKKK